MLTVERKVDALPEEVWKVLVDIDAWPQWGPTISGARLDGPGSVLSLGSTGQVLTPVGLALPFVITEFELGRSWGWTVAGVAATRHRVEPVAGGSRMSFAVPWWAPAYLTVCYIALRNIEDIAVK